MIFITCLLTFVFILFSGIIIILVLDQNRKNKLFKIITNFEQYISVLEYHMQKAYDIIYKDKILIYSLEATKVNDSEFNVILKEFVKLVFKLIGTNLKEELIMLYGDEDTLIFNLIEYFNSKFENDEIRKKATDNIMESDEEKNIFSG